MARRNTFRTAKKMKQITISIPQKDWDRVMRDMVREFKYDYEIPNPEKTLKGLIVDIFGNDMAESLWDGVLDNYGEEELKGLGIKLIDTDDDCDD